MQQNNNVKSWIDCWKALQGKSDWVKKLGSVDLWNQRADMFAKKLRPRKTQKRMKEILGLLNDAGFRAKGSRVLDIGCGPGAISVPLARAGAKVASLDISYKALEYLKANADKEGLSIETVERSWWDVDIDRLRFRNAFDLVVTSMTPALKDIAAFNRMMACSRKFCYYSHFLSDSPGWNNEALFRNILKKGPSPKGGGISPFMYHFVYLYLNGYKPIVRIQHKAHKMQVPWEDAADSAIKFWRAAGACSTADRKKIREHFMEASIEGKYCTQYGGYTGMMVWKVNRK